jgi:hypothetical protein
MIILKYTKLYEKIQDIIKKNILSEQPAPCGCRDASPNRERGGEGFARTFFNVFHDGFYHVINLFISLTTFFRTSSETAPN